MRRRRAGGRTPRRVQRWTSYGRISPDLKRAVLWLKTTRSGSRRGGLDSCRSRSERIGRAAGSARGGSTITQQLAKTL